MKTRRLFTVHAGFIKHIVSFLLVLALALSVSAPAFAQSGGITNLSSNTQQNYIVGSTRNFKAEIKNTTDASAFPTVLGRLVKQGRNVNIWVLDKASYDAAMGADAGAVANQCVLEDVANDSALLDEMADRFDDIINRVTAALAPYRGVKVTVDFSNMPAVGDINGDGRVNVLLYNIGGTTGDQKYGGTDGLFDVNCYISSDSYTPISLVHVDIARSHGYKLATGDETQKQDFYTLFTHEFQHLLFFIHFNVYRVGDMNSDTSFIWFDESLSYMAMTLYTQEGKERPYGFTARQGATNFYSGYVSKYRDFLNYPWGVQKNALMSMLHGLLMQKMTDGEYAGAVYRYFNQLVPTSTTREAYNVNVSRIRNSSMPEILGDAFAAAGIVSDPGVRGAEAFRQVYFMFMENFAADGGNIYTPSGTRSTVKLFSDTSSDYNLWSERNGEGLRSGDTVELKGYGISSPDGATHEMMYALRDYDSEINPEITISINDNDSRTKYYVVLPRAYTTGYLDPQNGQYGADVYPLSANNVVNTVYTGGKRAYLFVVTLFRDVRDVEVTYSWQQSAVEKTQEQARAEISGIIDSSVCYIAERLESSYAYSPEYTGYKGSAVDEWAKREINIAGKLRVMPAEVNGYFHDQITRGDFAILIHRALVTLTDISEMRLRSILPVRAFTDTDDERIGVVAGLGIITGYQDGTFRPDEPITRQEAATMLSRLAGVVGAIGGEPLSFSDISDRRVWGAEYISHVSSLYDVYSGNRVMGGVGDNRFDPHGLYTRQQAVLTIVRMIGLAADSRLGN